MVATTIPRCHRGHRRAVLTPTNRRRHRAMLSNTNPIAHPAARVTSIETGATSDTIPGRREATPTIHNHLPRLLDTPNHHLPQVARLAHLRVTSLSDSTGPLALMTLPTIVTDPLRTGPHATDALTRGSRMVALPGAVGVGTGAEAGLDRCAS